MEEQAIAETDGTGRPGRMPWTICIACVIADVYCALAAATVSWFAATRQDAAMLLVLLPLSLMLGGCVDLHRGHKWTRRILVVVGASCAIGLLLIVINNRWRDAFDGVFFWMLPLVVLSTLLCLPSSRAWWRPEGRLAWLSRLIWVLIIPVVLVLMQIAIEIGVGIRGEHMRTRGLGMGMQGRNIHQTFVMPGISHDLESATNSTDFVNRLVAKSSATGEGSASDFSEALVGGVCQWCIAVNALEDIDDVFPVMFTANIDPADIPLEWDETSGKERIPLKAFKTLEGEWAVIVRKGGASQVLRRKYLTASVFYGAPTGRISGTVTYLTPDGRVTLGSRKTERTRSMQTQDAQVPTAR